MGSRGVSTLLELADQSRGSGDPRSTKRLQGRPTRGGSEVGSHKIVEGMRAAIRALQNAQVSRNDVAGYAGVTPALVTYYFPERTKLIEAATLPVVQGLVDTVRTCVERDGPARPRLRQTIEVLLAFYVRDAAIVALFDQHRTSSPDSALPDLSKDLDTLVEAFFEAWLIDHPSRIYDAAFLRKAMIGGCRALARQPTGASGHAATEHRDLMRAAEMMCALLVGPSPAGPTTGAPTLVDTGGRRP